MTPEIVTGISLLVFFQWVFHWLHFQLGMATVIIIAHVAFFHRVCGDRGDRAAGELRPGFGRSGDGFGRDALAGFLARNAAGVASRHHRRVPVGFDRFVRRLRHHQFCGGRRFGDAADGDLCDGAAGSEPFDQCDLFDHCGVVRHPDHDFGEAPRGAKVERRSFLGAAGLAALACDSRPRLNVYNWSSYIAPETVPNFERESGVRVRYAVYESNEEMLAKVITGNSGWDIVFPTHSRIGPMRANALLKPLERQRLPNLKYLSAEFQAPAWDPELQWSVPYMWNATGIAYRKKLGLAKWSDMWRSDLTGRITMLDDPEDVIGACLQKLGMPFDATDPRQLAAAKEEAVRQKRLVRAYINAEVKDQLVAGDVMACPIVVDHSEPGDERKHGDRVCLSRRGVSAVCGQRRDSGA